MYDDDDDDDDGDDDDGDFEDDYDDRFEEKSRPYDRRPQRRPVEGSYQGRSWEAPREKRTARSTRDSEKELEDQRLQEVIATLELIHEIQDQEGVKFDQGRGWEAPRGAAAAAATRPVRDQSLEEELANLKLIQEIQDREATEWEDRLLAQKLASSLDHN